jgi:hypothetical protein
MPRKHVCLKKSVFLPHKNINFPETKRRGRVVNTPVSYSGGLGFKSWPRRLWLMFFVVFLSISRRMLGQYLKIRPRPLPTKSFPIHHHSFITLSQTLYNLKAKAVPLHATEALERERRYSSYSFSTSALDGELSASRLGRRLALGKGLPVPVVQEAGWASEPVTTHRLEEESFRLCRGSNLDRWVVQPVTRHYTDWAIRLTLYNLVTGKSVVK